MQNTFDNWQGFGEELEHHGIKGMKWGVRRYTNKDGSLTSVGRRRYRSEVKKLQKLKSKADISQQAALAEKYDTRARKAAKIGKAGLAVAGADIARAAGSTALRAGTRSLIKDMTAPGKGHYVSTMNMLEKASDTFTRGASFSPAFYGGSITAAVAYGTAAAYKLKARSARKLTSELGHMKAVHRAQEQATKIEQKFGGIPYSELAKQQSKKTNKS